MLEQFDGPSATPLRGAHHARKADKHDVGQRGDIAMTAYDQGAM
jgi:hypothetical protein